VVLEAEATGFGEVVIDGEKYEKDLVINTDGTITKRKKKMSKKFKPDYGHTPLSEKELDILEEQKPEVVYIGTGYDGALPITPKAQTILKNYPTIVGPTPEIIPKLAADKRKLVAIIHLTC
jgi:hypothetical protein